jgi:hypothetical protein
VPEPEIPIDNTCGVGKSGDVYVFLMPPKVLSEHDALVLAAYIVAMAGDEEKWQRILEAVQNS